MSTIIDWKQVWEKYLGRFLFADLNPESKKYITFLVEEQLDEMVREVQADTRLERKEKDYVASYYK